MFPSAFTDKPEDQEDGSTGPDIGIIAGVAAGGSVIIVVLVVITIVCVVKIRRRVKSKTMVPGQQQHVGFGWFLNEYKNTYRYVPFYLTQLLFDRKCTLWSAWKCIPNEYIAWKTR